MMMLGLLWSCQSDVPPPGVPAAPSEQVMSAPRLETSGYVGVVVPEQAVVLSAHSTGVVERALFEAVEAGDLVAVVQSPTLLAEIETARARIEVASAQAEQVRRSIRDATRRADEAEALLDRGAISQESWRQLALERDRHELDLRRAVAEVAVREAEAASLVATRDANRLLAPFDGRVSRWFVETGERVTAGEPVVRVAAIDTLQVRFAVPAEDTPVLQIGDSVRVEPDDGVADPVEAVIEAIAPELDPSSQMTFVVAGLPLGSPVIAGQACHVWKP